MSCRWLAQQAEALGVEIYPGFAAAEVLYDEDGPGARASPPATWASPRTARKGPNFQPGMELRASSRCSPRAAAARSPRRCWSASTCATGVQPQTYGARHQGAVGDPEPEKHRPGLVIAHHRLAAATRSTYGGSWLYMFGENLVSVGFVVGLDYANP